MIVCNHFLFNGFPMIHLINKCNDIIKLRTFGTFRYSKQICLSIVDFWVPLFVTFFSWTPVFVTQFTFTSIASAFIGVIYNKAINILLGDIRNVSPRLRWLVVLSVWAGSKEDMSFLCILVHCHISNLYSMPVMSLHAGHFYCESNKVRYRRKPPKYTHAGCSVYHEYFLMGALYVGI